MFNWERPEIFGRNRKREYRGFSYNYDLGSVKVEKPIPKAIGKAAKKWLSLLGLSEVELMLVAREEHDPLSSGVGIVLFKGDVMLAPREKRRDFDLVCILLENNAEGTFFKQRDKMKRTILRELVHLVHPDTVRNREKGEKIIASILAQ